MRVGFASTHGGCAHYRAQLPARALAARGVETYWSGEALDVLPQGGAFGIPGVVPDPEVIVLAGGWPARLGPDHVRAARRAGQRIVCDCDDWPWLPAENPYADPRMPARKIAALRAADVVTCSTPALVRCLADEGITAYLAPNYVDASMYREAHDVNTARRASARESDELVIGYRGMLAGFHDADVRELRGLALERVRFVHVGAETELERGGATFAGLVGVNPFHVERRPAVPFGPLFPPLLAGVDVAVIPFASRPFSQAKSNIAALEWNAAGVPWLASSQPEYERLLRAACMRSARQWRGSLAALRAPWAREVLLTDQTTATVRRALAQAAGTQWLAAISDAAGLKAPV